MKNGFLDFVHSHAFIVFLILTFIISWFPWYTGQGGLLVFGPSMAGLIVIILTQGRAGLRSLTRSAIRVKANAAWWLIALLLPAAVAAAAISVSLLLGNPMPKIAFFTGAWYSMPLFFLVTIVGGPLGEEIGWRGFAQPYLQQKKNAFAAALVIGLSWGLWHLPQFFTPNTLHYSLGIVYLPLFVLGELALSVTMAWIFNNTNKSLLLAGFLFHNADNFWGVVLTTDASAASALNFENVSVNITLWVISVIIYAAFAAVLVIATKGRLGLK